MMGHEDLSTTQLYQHLGAQYLKDQGAKLAGLLQPASNGDLDKNGVRGNSGGIVHMDKFKTRRKAGQGGR